MRTRPTILALTAAAGLFATAAQANPAAIVGGVVASVVGTAISNHNQPKLASCTLFDQDGRPVQVSCPADAPGALPPPGKAKRARGQAGPELAGGPPPPIAPQYQDQYADQAWDRPAMGPGPRGEIAPPPAQMTYLSGGMPDARCISCTTIAPPPPPPPRGHDCGCDGPAPAYGAGYSEQYRGADVHQPRAVASFLGGASGSSRSSSSYSSYEESSEQVSGGYEARTGYYASGYGLGAGGPGGSVGGYGYGYGASVDGSRYSGYSASAGGYSAGGGYGYGDVAGYAGGYGQGGYGQAYDSGYASGAGIGFSQDGGVGGYGGGFYPYGGYGYQNGGYADGYGYRARVSGRDPNGFLTWPGKQ